MCLDERPVQKKNLPLTFDFLISLRLLKERKTQIIFTSICSYLTCAALLRSLASHVYDHYHIADYPDDVFVQLFVSSYFRFATVLEARSTSGK